MYKVIVVDDDVEILEYIEHLLDWEIMGFRVMGTAVNGTQALKLIEEIGPDLLITDISMPGITGLELVRTAKLKNAGLKSMILTCHESFQYAKEAITLGVQDYLVKYMLDQAQLEECVAKIKKVLDRELQASMEVRNDKRRLRINSELEVSQLLRELIQSGNNDDYMFRRRLDESALSGLDVFHVIGFCIDNWLLYREHNPLRNMKLLHFAVMNIINEILAGKPEQKECATKAYSCNEELIVVFWKQTFKKTADKNALVRKLETIRKTLWNVLKLEVSCVISSSYSDIGAFQEIYQWIMQMRYSYFYPNANHIVWNTAHLESWKTQDKVGLSYELMDAARTLEYSAIMEQIRREYSDFYQTHVAPEKVIRYFKRFVLFLEAELRNQGVEPMLNSGKADTFEGCQILTEQMVVRYLEAATGEQKGGQRREIADVVNHMNTHLQDAITCEGMAQMANMNVSYFSKLFKKETGESFSDYLIRIRIERATLLLQHSDLTMEEITEAVGWANMHYFYRMYKKQTGKTPGMVRRGQ